jgi:predicted short-subunit dehydrogenase-like oxidoreductase (DUF2520 family)
MNKSTIGRRTKPRRPTVAIVGAGGLANFLAVALRQAGFTITEIIARNSIKSRRRARVLAEKVGAKTATANSAALDATLLWFCVPDREIRNAASALAIHLTASKSTDKKTKSQSKIRFAFHSSGALLSRELEPLRNLGTPVASVHPLMTFVAGAHPSLTGVPFAIEGDQTAMRLASQIVRALGGENFPLAAARKAAYHAWATLSSPLFLAFLVTLEQTASIAGLNRKEAGNKSLPIIMQTLENYSRLGPARSFSGPLVRGDADTVARHLSALKKYPGVREVYTALAQAALSSLPVKNREAIARLLQD